MTRKRLAQLSVDGRRTLLLYAMRLRRTAPGDARSWRGRGARRAATPGQAPHPAIRSMPDMVAAVSPADPVRRSASIRSRRAPVVGAPAQLMLALVADPRRRDQPHPRLAPARGGSAAAVPAHLRYRRRRRTAPRWSRTSLWCRSSAGVLSLSATVVVDYDAGSIARTYVIPLIASAS